MAVPALMPSSPAFVTQSRVAAATTRIDLTPEQGQFITELVASLPAGTVTTPHSVWARAMAASINERLYGNTVPESVRANVEAAYEAFAKVAQKLVEMGEGVPVSSNPYKPNAGGGPIVPLEGKRTVRKIRRNEELMRSNVVDVVVECGLQEAILSARDAFKRVKRQGLGESEVLTFFKNAANELVPQEKGGKLVVVDNRCEKLLEKLASERGREENKRMGLKWQACEL